MIYRTSWHKLDMFSWHKLDMFSCFSCFHMMGNMFLSSIFFFCFVSLKNHNRLWSFAFGIIENTNACLFCWRIVENHGRIWKCFYLISFFFGKPSHFGFFIVFQMRKFRRLETPAGKNPPHMCDNFRPVQPLNGRSVFQVHRIWDH